MHTPPPNVTVRSAEISDLNALITLENHAFSGDRLSRRSFRHSIMSVGSVLLVALNAERELLGYALLHLRQGTRLARLYSLAVATNTRGMGIGSMLITACEKKAIQHGKIQLRLEVSEANQSAISLYKRMGYREFGHYHAYYEDQSDALRMQKMLRHFNQEQMAHPVPWLAQRTPFTCGPASLQMVLSALQENYTATPDDELDIWREATTIFMTSGHGGCHPMGLALAAQKRGLTASVWVSQEDVLFLDGVRNELKKDIMTRVHQSFVKQCEEQAIAIHYSAMSLMQLTECFDEGKLAIILISTYRMDGKKAPHWVVMSGYDDHCIFVHDPDIGDETQNALDCQYVPIAREEFEKMSRFGLRRLQAVVLLQP